MIRNATLAAATILTLSAAYAVGLEEKPFPTSSTTLRTDGALYFVRGRQAIPRNAKIVSLRKMKVHGLGEEAVLEVSGILELKAVTGGEVILEDVWLELTPECRSLYLSHVSFTGKGGIRPSPRGPSKAKVFVESTKFTNGAQLLMDCTGGSISLNAVHATEPVVIRGIPRSDKAGSTLELQILSCQGKERNGPYKGFTAGLIVEGVKEVLVRNNYLGGKLSRFLNNGAVDFDGNNARSVDLEFIMEYPKDFKRVKVHNCDFRSQRVKFYAPGTGKKAQRLVIDHSWFDTGTEAAVIKAAQIIDNDVDPSNGVLVKFKKIVPIAMGLGGRAGSK
ncbi:MAG: hypothetical protein E2O39_04700 [Planctomycetota bacterium]|nr:MAG: hypothetical protein E2O39_04700 [Planctomycetota bacterium]